jgi:hypothetical protein
MTTHTYYEHQGVHLTVDLPAHRVFASGMGKMGVVGGKPGVPKGTFAFIVSLPNQEQFLLEIMDGKGNTIGLADVEASEVRPEVPDRWKTATPGKARHDVSR